ncbi:MAG: hypothetical protein EOQ39_18640 [Mesorhizobium sp.]|uniref:hypothetical protein n=1 Tax=Mesorhizobium sp. TaxID=1871066 RepID=UPI000FE62D89|nr:hypothetical protein [Mesorhizobium sp.]RWB08812.1 MAG: hypothetical protein EOQ37_04705 [Mesorhizobium sp.]RWB13538.1 MAG: hypothetical protein EOQ39_18640 [Mesorhizobium sp.]
MTYRLEHDWTGHILIKAGSGETVATLTKHAAGTPGSGIPADTHIKLQTHRAQVMVDALNEDNIK